MEGVLGVAALGVLSVVCFGFLNRLGEWVFGVTQALGGILGAPIGRRSDRLAGLGILFIVGPWGWLFNNLFALALIVAIPGTFFVWGIAPVAVTISGWMLLAAAVCYFLGGFGEGINQAQKWRILTTAGYASEQVALLDKRPNELTAEEAAFVLAEREVLADCLHVGLALRRGAPDQAELMRKMPRD